MAQAAGVAHDDEDHLVIHGEARTGRALKGEVRLANAREQEIYKVELFCRRRVLRGDRLDAVPYEESATVAVRRDAKGWFLPFEFDIPLSAPFSRGREIADAFFDHLPYEWKLGVRRRGLFAGTDYYDLEVTPARLADVLAAEEKLPEKVRREMDELTEAVEAAGGELPIHQRARIANLSDADRNAAKVVMPWIALISSPRARWIMVIGVLVFAVLGLFA